MEMMNLQLVGTLYDTVRSVAESVRASNTLFSVDHRKQRTCAGRQGVASILRSGLRDDARLSSSTSHARPSSRKSTREIYRYMKLLKQTLMTVLAMSVLSLSALSSETQKNDPKPPPKEKKDVEQVDKKNPPPEDKGNKGSDKKGKP